MQLNFAGVICHRTSKTNSSCWTGEWSSIFISGAQMQTHGSPGNSSLNPSKSLIQSRGSTNEI